MGPFSSLPPGKGTPHIEMVMGRGLAGQGMGSRQLGKLVQEINVGEAGSR